MSAQKHNSSHMKFSWGAAILIALGIIFLLQNFGLVSDNIFDTIWKLWPLFLILAGFHILYHRHR